MRYVKVESIQDSVRGYFLDADDYLDVLPEIAVDLPVGARRFALDEEHYNFFGSRCVKDLKLSSVVVSDVADRVSVKLVFAPNRFKHDQGLVIEYTDVTGFAIEVTASARTANVRPETRRLGDVQLDEILPHEQGVSHEITLTGGTVRVIAADLYAGWRDETV